MSPDVTLTRKKAPPAGGDFGYSNARIRGMRSRLLRRDFFDSLIEDADLKRLVQSLSETEYGPDLEDVLIQGLDAGTVDTALKQNMVRTFQKVLGFLNDEAALLVTTLMGRWDVFNIKTILRGKQMGLRNEEIIEGVLPVGSLDSVDLLALASLADVRAVVDTVVTWGLPFAPALREGHALFVKNGELAEVELALDRYYSEWASARLRRRGNNARLASTVIETQVDISNLVMVFRLQKEDAGSVDVERFFLGGGGIITADLYSELVKMSDIDEVLNRLKGTRYSRALDEVATLFLEVNSISVFERALEDLLTRRTLGLAKGDPLGVGVAISYLWAKQNEVTNLRIIVKGKAVGMPIERVRKELILV